jgi:hypothetical protein
VEKKTAAKRTPRPRRDDYGELINFRISGDLRRRIKIYAASRDLRLGQLLEQLFEAYIAREAKDAG